MPRLLLLLLPCLWSPGVGTEGTPAPLRPRFVAKTFHHLLQWDKPAPNAAPHQQLLYEVQYRRYGKNGHWTPVPRCMGTGRLSCDLSRETQELGQRYYAQVRAMAGPQNASKWVQSLPFRPEEATLWLSNVSLAIRNGLVRLSIQLPISPWGNITFENLYRFGWQFHAHVRRVSSADQNVQVETSTEFDLQDLIPDEEYCVSVEPRLASRATPGIRTEEQCFSLLPPALLPLEEGHTQAALLLSLPILGALVASLGLAWAYMKRPSKTWPEALSVLKSGSPQAPQLSPAPAARELVLQLEREPIGMLSILGPKGQSNTGQAQPWSAGPVPLAPEKSCWWMAWATEGGLTMGGSLAGGSSIGGSTDSGICLQEPSGSLGQLLSLGVSGQEGGLPEDPHGGIWAEVGAPREGLSGYQKQVGGPWEEAACCGATLGTEGTSGYLKQSSLHGPGAAAEQKGPGQSGLPGWTDLGSAGLPSDPLGIRLL